MKSFQLDVFLYCIIKHVVYHRARMHDTSIVLVRAYLQSKSNLDLRDRLQSLSDDELFFFSIQSPIFVTKSELSDVSRKVVVTWLLSPD